MAGLVALVAEVAWTVRVVRTALRELWDLPAEWIPAARQGYAAGRTALGGPTPPVAVEHVEVAADQPAEPAQPEREPEPVRPARPAQSSPVEADPDLAAHLWPDGGMGHTGDVWMPSVHVEHIACGAYHPEVKAWCHREPRHQAHEIESRCRGEGADGQIYTWAVVDPEP